VIIHHATLELIQAGSSTLDGDVIVKAANSSLPGGDGEIADVQR
jgi:hypothetical protein